MGIQLFMLGDEWALTLNDHGFIPWSNGLHKVAGYRGSGYYSFEPESR